jgi:beta-N-acetylhexosaminidase
MEGIVQRLGAMKPETAARLDRALAGTRVDGASGTQAALLAKRDQLLALAEA